MAEISHVFPIRKTAAEPPAEPHRPPGLWSHLKGATSEMVIQAISNTKKFYDI